jgi:branched-subunit amino acid transport protein
VRDPVLALVGKIHMPAMLTALIVPAMLYKNDQFTISDTPDFLVAGIVSAIVAWRSKNLLLTIVIGTH